MVFKKTAVLISFLGVFQTRGNWTDSTDYTAGSVFRTEFYVSCGSIETFQAIYCIDETL